MNMSVPVSATRCLKVDCSFKSTQVVISDSLAGHCQVPRHVARISEWKSGDVDSNLSCSLLTLSMLAIRSGPLCLI